MATTYTDNPTNDKEKRIKHLLFNREIWFVPLVNPDGHNVTITSERMWRQNNHSQSIAAGSVTRAAGTVTWPKFTALGVDVNRNYDVKAIDTPKKKGKFLAWGTETFHPNSGDIATSQDPRDSSVDQQVYCGPSAASEPETQAIQKLINANPFRSTISFHNFGEEWLWPGPLKIGSDDDFVDWVGNGATDVMGTMGHKYTYKGGPDPYLTSGDMIDFTFTTRQWRPAYTPEVRPSSGAPAGTRFSGLPESEIEPCFKENLGATLAVINCAGHDIIAKPQTVSTTTAMPPQKMQYVKNCWEVFLNWVP